MGLIPMPMVTKKKVSVIVNQLLRFKEKREKKKKKNSNCEPDSDEEPIKYILYGGTFFPFGT